jgi:hypothetical protein
VASGVGAASDPLIAVAGFAPLALVAVSSATVRWPVGVCLGAAAAAWGACLALISATGLRAAGTLPIRVASPGRLDDNVGIVLRALADVVDGRFVGSAFGGSTLVHAGAAALAAAAVAAIAVWIVRTLGRRDLDSALRAHIVFWVASAVALLAAVTLTTVPLDVTCSRYLIGMLLALGALLPLLGGTSRLRAIIGAGVAVYACVGLMSLARGEFTVNGAHAPNAATATALARFAAREHVAVGYAGYWDAAPLTWSARFAVPVFPVRMCDEQGRPCAFEFHQISSWYRPRPGVRSMLVIDRAIRTIAVTTLDPGLGQPASIHNVGQLRVAVFDYDIARRFARPAPRTTQPSAARPVRARPI